MTRQLAIVSLVTIFAAAMVPGCSKTKSKSSPDKSSSAKSPGMKNGTGKKSKTAKDVLAGTWKLEWVFDEAKLTEITKASFKKEAGMDPTAEQLKEAVDQAKAAIKPVLATLPTGTITMNADGTSSSVFVGPDEADPTKTKEEKEKGTWEVAKEDGKKVTIKVTTTEGKEKGKVTEFMVTLTDDSTFVVDDSSDPELKAGLKQLPATMTWRKQ